MNIDNQKQLTQNEVLDEEDQISVLDVLLTIAKNLKLLVFGPLIFGSFVLALGFIYPNIYTAKVTILPPEGGALTSSSLILNSLGGLGGVAGDLVGLKNPGQRYVAYIKSDAFLDVIIKKFDLHKVYDKKSSQAVREILQGRLKASSEKQSNMITIEVDDVNPNFAAELANGIVVELRNFVGKLDLQEAMNRRNFLEEQIKEVSSRPFQDAFSQQAIIGGLVRQFELAKVDEARVGPTFIQVDFASPPEFKSRPTRALNAIIATLICEALLLIFIFLRIAFSQNLQAQHKMAKIIEAIKVFFLDIKGWPK